jgi:hypothetical protein
MKKVTTLLIVAAMLASMTGCGGDDTPITDNGNNNGTGTTATTADNSNDTEDNLVSLEVEYTGNSAPNTTVLASEFDVTAVYESGETVSLSDRDFQLSGNTQLVENETHVLTITYEGMSVEVTIEVPEMKFLGTNRQRFVERFENSLGLQYDVTRNLSRTFVMELKEEEGVITQASFRLDNGQYWYFIYFSAPEGEEDERHRFTEVRLENNTQMNMAEWDVIRRVFITTVTPSATSVPERIERMGLNGGFNFRDVDYTSFYNASHGTLNLPFGSFTATIRQGD